MRKISSLIIAAFMVLSLNVAANSAGLGIGVTYSMNTLATAGKEDVDTNGTIDATKNVNDDIEIGSIFGEYTMVGSGKLAMTIGVDIIPFDADISKREITQTHLEGKATTITSGTNSVSASIEDHFTVYLQPGIMVNDSTMFYATAGYSSASVIGKSVSITHTDINKTQKLKGTTIGAGIKHVKDSGLFFKLDYKETEYNTIDFTTTNNTKATADLDNEAFALSIGKQF